MPKESLKSKMDEPKDLRAVTILSNETERKTFFKKQLNLVYSVAHQLKKTRLSDGVELDELVSAGSVGLMEAVEKFNPGLGFTFSTFAVPRIRGAMLDELRSQDRVSRGVRHRIHKIETAREELAKQLHRAPKDREVAQHLKIDVKTLWRWKSEAESATHISLDQPKNDQNNTFLELFDPPTTGDNIESQLAEKERATILRKAMQVLEDRERKILELYYFQGIKQEKIATIVNLSEVRVGQIRVDAEKKLKEKLQHLY
ncbi:MAG: FliA/WhiG family RNA polymerase sigma factor [bacterium]|nr:FliA/WhiG family RNA polymerase sigma factor [bacterium]